MIWLEPIFNGFFHVKWDICSSVSFYRKPFGFIHFECMVWCKKLRRRSRRRFPGCVLFISYVNFAEINKLQLSGDFWSPNMRVSVFNFLGSQINPSFQSSLGLNKERWPSGWSTAFPNGKRQGMSAGAGQTYDVCLGAYFRMCWIEFEKTSVPLRAVYKIVQPWRKIRISYTKKLLAIVYSIFLIRSQRKSEGRTALFRWVVPVDWKNVSLISRI